MNKRGIMLLRNIVFMIILFGGVMAMASIFVLDMADEYSNTNMTTEYNHDGVGGVGNETMYEIDKDMDEMKDATDGNSSSSALGSFSAITGALTGAGKIIGIVFTSPVIIGNALDTLMTSIGVPTTMSKIIGDMVSFLIYAVVIFGIITAVLRGGKV